MANTIPGFPAPPANAPAPVAAPPPPANPAPGIPVANPAAGMTPNAGTNPKLRASAPGIFGRLAQAIERRRNAATNPQPAPATPASNTAPEWTMHLSPLGRVAKAIGMLSYGEQGLTPRAAASLGAIGLAVIMCTVFEIMLNWRGSGLLFAHEAWYLRWLFRLVFISVLGTLVYVMDMSWGARDMNNNLLRSSLVKPRFFSKENFWRLFHVVFGYTARGFYTRVGCLLILVTFNSMSGHVSFFGDEIEHDIKDREATNVTSIRQVAMNAIAPAHWDAIDDARDAIPRDPRDTTPAQRLNTRNTQPVCYTLRCRQRRELVTSNTVEEQRNTDRIRTIQNGNDRESERGRAGRPPGRGREWTRGQTAEQAREAAFNRVRAENRATLAAFDAASERALQNAVSNWEAANERIRTMDKDKLANDYGRTWRISRGALEQLNTLYKLLWRNKLMLAIAIAIMLLIQVPTLMVMGAGYLMFNAARDYLSEVFQAVNGNEEVRRALAYKGITNPEALLRAPELRELDAQYYALCAAISTEVRNLLNRIGYHCRKRSDGTWPTLREVQQALRTEWGQRTLGLVQVHMPEEIEGENDTSAEVEHTTASADDADVVNLTVIYNGAKALVWPEILNGGVDPRILGQEPWRVSKETLSRDYGWEDPEKDLPEQEMIAKDIKAIRREILEMILALDAQTVAFMGDPLKGKKVEDIDDRLLRAPLLVVRLLRAQWWHEKGEPIYRRLALAYNALLDVGGKIPDWHVALVGTGIPVDPRKYHDVQRYACFITEGEMRRLDGGSVGLNSDWTPERRAPVQTATPPVAKTGNGATNGQTHDHIEELDPSHLDEATGQHPAQPPPKPVAPQPPSN